ncbi:hypothetical protein JCM33374_g1982 [Metschnikowia sp. JCM 33374]|nr:hypothetical protein JCM33374_g1982 [Metschnikowia sp. JCM 33374]
MTTFEEKSLKDWIIYLNYVGIAPKHEEVRAMANKMLAARGTTPRIIVGANWLPIFVNRSGELEIRISQTRDLVRTNSETPEIFSEWFARVRSTISEFGIIDDDVYNVDETGFAIGMLAPSAMTP